MKTTLNIVAAGFLILLAACTQKQTNKSCCKEAFEYVGGYPTEATIEKAYEQLDIQRASQAYLHFMSMTSQNAIFESTIKDYGLTNPGDVGIYTEPGEGKSEAIGLTYNTESIYSTAFTDLKADGPTVVETPPNVLGMVDDGWMRFITDLGNAGPDKGQGGKYLLLPSRLRWQCARWLFCF